MKPSASSNDESKDSTSRRKGSSPSAFCGEKLFSLRGLTRQSCLEQLIDLLPAFGCHNQIAGSLLKSYYLTRAALLKKPT